MRNALNRHGRNSTQNTFFLLAAHTQPPPPLLSPLFRRSPPRSIQLNSTIACATYTPHLPLQILWVQVTLMPTYSRHAERGGERGCRWVFFLPSYFCLYLLRHTFPHTLLDRHKAVSRLGNHSVNRVKNRMRRKGGKRDSTMDGFLLPGAKSHYVPDLMIFPVHQGTAIEEREKEHFLFRISGLFV